VQIENERFRIDPLRSLLPIIETSLTVVHLAESDLQYLDPAQHVAAARDWMSRKGFDAAPVREPRPHRYVALAELTGKSGTVEEVAVAIDARLLVAADTGLAEGVAMLAASPFYFVMSRNELTGIVTRADLQRPAVTIVALGLILTAEAGMNRIIEACLPDWLDRLGTARESVEELYQQRRRTNAEIGYLECLMLHQRMKLLSKCPDVVDQLGLQGKERFLGWKEELVGLRDVLAHGGGLLDREPDPVTAIQLFHEVKRFTHAVWSLIPAPVRSVS
jgi:hypothetical protein